jgi:HEAT repeat protein
MTQKTRRRGFLASAEGVKKLKKAKSEKGYSYPQIAQEAYVEIESVKRLFNPHWGNGKYKIGEDFIEAIAKVLDLDPPDIVDGWYPPGDTSEQQENSPSADLPDWRRVCRVLLDAQNQRSLTTNPLTCKDGIKFDLDEIYVDLTLEYRPKREKIKDNTSAKQDSKLDNPTEENKKYQNKEFFEQVLRQFPEQGNSKGRRIAIIGEPGAGKSTYQQKIGEWVFKNTETDVPILVSLAAIGNKPLNNYLSENWLRDAAQKLDAAPPEWKPAFEQLLKSGRVWLLLDGADEMDVTYPLDYIAKQLQQSWIQNVQVVLTCRLNVWDAGKNALEDFHTYRTSNFSYDDVTTFIENWFKSSPDLGNQLCEALEQPQKRKIKDTVKNPLMLAMLCYHWQLGEGKLPDTKSEIYQQFVDKFYEWKSEIFSRTGEQPEQLNQALGKLALKAISEQSSRVYMQESFIREVLEKPNPELFKLAIDLGWLKSVGVTAEQPCENAYAFFHTTFLEYFAALAVQDWHFFLNHTPDDPSVGTYRIFEPQWKEVILLWLGRKDLPPQKKENFIKALVEFKPRCSSFYKQQAIFLAAAGIAEFRECTLAVSVLIQVASGAFGYFDTNTRKWKRFPLSHEKAKAALLETDYDWAIGLLVYLLTTINDDEVCLEIALYLWENFINSPKIIEFVILLMCGKTGGQLTYQVNDEYKQKIKDKFIKTAKGNSIAIGTLVQTIRASISKYDWIAIYWLGEIGTKDSEAIDVLNQLIDATQDQDICKQASASRRKINYSRFSRIEGNYYPPYSTFKITPKTSAEVADLIHLLHMEQNEETRYKALEELAYATGSLDAIKALNDVLNSSQSEQIRCCAASSLRRLEPDNPLVLSTFTELVHTTCNPILLNEIIDEVYFIEDCELLLIFAIAKLIRVSKSSDEISNCIIEVLFEYKIGAGHPDLIHALIEKLRSSQDKEMRSLVALGLGAVDPGNPEACQAIIDILLTTHDENLIDSLILYARTICQENEEQMECLAEQLHKTKNEVTRWKLAAVLMRYQPIRLEAVTILTEALNKTQDKNIRSAIVENAPKYGEYEWIDALIYLLRYSQNSQICEWAARELKDILPVIKFPKVVTALKNYRQDHAHENQRDCYLCCEGILQHCAQNMSYPDFYRAWHNEPTAVDSESPDNIPVGECPTAQALENQFTDIAYQLQSTDKTYPIVINAQALEGEADTSAIAQELCNQIYLTAFPDELEIPEVSNAPQLKRLIPPIKKQLQKQNLALIVDNCEPNQEQVTFCRKLSDVLHIAWITNEPIEPPLKGFLPNQPNLLSAIQSWMDEID